MGRTATDARRRLTRSADFDAVYRQGRSTASRHAVVYAFPRSATHGLRWYEIDPTAYAIRALEAARLAWNVVEISPERQQQKAAGHRAQPA